MQLTDVCPKVQPRHSAASLRSWLWPLIIVLSSIGVSVVVLGDVHSPVRPLLAVWFLCLCPGMAFVRLLDIEDGYIRLTLAIALSLVLDMAVATALSYAHRWSPADILGLLAGLSLVGVALDVTVAYRRRRSTGHAVRGAREREQRIQASTVAALTVRTGGLDMEVQPAEVEGREATFRVTFVNRSPTPTPVRLSASDHEDRLRFRIEPEDTVIVPADGAADPITVHVAPKVRETMGRPKRHQLEFRGLLLGREHTDNPSLVGQARFTYVAPRQPAWLRWASRWAVLLALVLLLVFAGGRILALPATRPAATPPAPTRAVPSVQPTRPRATVQGSTLSRPSIRLFTLVHRHRGWPYELVWQISGAAHATLDGRPVPARGSLVLQAPLHSATYRLAATNGTRRATASLHLVVDALTTDPHAVVLTTADIATFALQRRKGQLYASWLVRNAVHVRLGDRLVASAGAQRVPAGATWVRLVASNDVGSRQRLLPLARLGPPVLRPTATPAPRPTDTPTAPPTATSTPRPTATSTPRPTATSTPRPTATPTPRPTKTPTPVSVTIGSTTAPVAVTSTPTAVSLTCC